MERRTGNFRQADSGISLRHDDYLDWRIQIQSCFAFGLVAEIERNLISMRTREAFAMRKSEGVILGRRPGSYTKTNVLRTNKETVIKMLREGRSIIEICRTFNVSRMTFTKLRSDFPEVAQAVTDGRRLGDGYRRKSLHTH